jgi:hypothetical protein
MRRPYFENLLKRTMGIFWIFQRTEIFPDSPGEIREATLRICPGVRAGYIARWRYHFPPFILNLKPNLDSRHELEVNLKHLPKGVYPTSEARPILPTGS